MTKDQFRKELFKFEDGLAWEMINSFNDHPSFKYHEYCILPVRYIRKVKFKTLGKHYLVFTIQPVPSIFFDVHFHSKLLYGLHPLKTPEKKWLDIGSKGFAYAQRWNRTVYDLLSDSRTNKYKKEIQLFDEFFDQSHIDPNDFKSLIGDPKKLVETNDSLWAIADDMRARKTDGEFPTFMAAYRWAAKHMTQNGKRFKAKSLQNEWHKARTKGLFE